MKLRDVFTFVWQVALLLFLIEAARWWFGGSPDWRRALDLTIWAGAILLTFAWKREDHDADAQAELERWRLTWAKYDRYLAVHPEAELVLRNLRAEVDGKSLSVSWPPAPEGPWEVSRLQAVLLDRLHKGAS